MEAGSHINVLSLFIKPNKWSLMHLAGLRIERHDRAHMATIVGNTQLPRDDDPLFETLAKDFAQPTKEQLLRDDLALLYNNQFMRAFDDIWSALYAFEHGYSVQSELCNIANEFIKVTRPTYLDSSYSYSSISFYLSSLKIRGKFTGVGTYYRPLDKGLPFTIFVGRKGPDRLCSAEEVVPYLLLQAILKYERNPTLDSHTAFVVSMKGTTLQFNKGAVSREYLKDLIRRKVPSDPLMFLRSDPYELLEQDGRRECVRGFLGLIRNIHTQLELYEAREH
ncbi:hypothetical protein GX50_03002 [[Emmonsia] crescens]|uniref:Uncharacterized protein n=1 Tax=[Emmonsia] crescens TaxID=73230 RepID=A0A2B7ZCF2_9EURO|nr:hypothetical protein GX50_03002 [Emmonsia crescens]